EKRMTQRHIRGRGVAIAAAALIVLIAHLVAQTRSGNEPAASENDWPTYNRTYAGDRFSPLNDITASNVGRLRQVCVYDTAEEANFQTGPLVIGGVLYFSSDAVTYSIDAATCALKWKQPHGLGDTSLRVNRGVAFDSGRLFRGAGNGHVLGIDA